VTAGPFFAACLLLVASGLVKLVRPGAATDALARAGGPDAPLAARLLGAAEDSLPHGVELLQRRLIIGAGRTLCGNQAIGQSSFRGCVGMCR